MFFSPLSIAVSFGMLFQGARGDTAKELANVMGFGSAEKGPAERRTFVANAALSLMESLRGIDKETVVLEMANTMFMQQGYNVSLLRFLQTLKQRFSFLLYSMRGGSRRLLFESVNIIINSCYRFQDRIISEVFVRIREFA